MGIIIKNIAKELQYEYIQDLKKNKETAFLVEEADDSKTYIKICNRGEQMFYLEGDRAFICEISVLYDIVFTESINKWDNGKKIKPKEKEKIISNIQKFFKQNYNTTIRFT